MLGPIQFLILMNLLGLGGFIIFHFNAENLLRRKFRRKNMKYYLLFAIGVLMVSLIPIFLRGITPYTIITLVAASLPLLYITVFELLRATLFTDHTEQMPVLVSDFKGFYRRMHDGYKPSWREKLFSVSIFALPLLFYIMAVMVEFFV